MKRKRHLPARLGLPLICLGIAGLLASSAFFFMRGRTTLIGLIEHGQNVKTTDVFSAWCVLSGTSTYTWDGLQEELKAREYDAVSEEPREPGQFNAAYPTLTIFLREFEYPDFHAPAERVRLRFTEKKLNHAETVEVNLPTPPEWRLEPKRLAQWAGNGSISHPQVRLSDLPAYVPQAIVAMEDKRFYKHGAFDLFGMLRALAVDLRKGHLRQGASTISQQLARSIFLTTRRSFTRKMMEAVLAAYLEFRFSKQQLLEMYLNQVYWGQDGSVNIIGIESAARAYFGKPAHQLSLAEAALLAGILQSPNHYSPRGSPLVAIERRDLVLKLLEDQNLISAAQYKDAKKEPLKIVAESAKPNEAAYFLTTLQDQLEERYPGIVLPVAGWKIFTTIEPVLQQAAVSAVSRLRRGPQAALVAIDPRSGAITAWVGGTDFARAPFDRAARAHRQPGSTFKTLVMLAALDKRVATEATLLKDEPLMLKTAKGRWSPQNFDRKYRHQVPLWDALVQSLNVPTVTLALQVGLPVIQEYARRAGIVSALKPFPSTALGASEVTLPEMTGAYATLAADGVSRPSYDVEAVLDADGRPIEHHQASAQQAFDPASVFLVTTMLRAVLTEGTGASSKALGLTIDAAGKTGTSENFQDAWFVGYTPLITCGVWVGYDKPKSLGHSAAGIALPLWVPFMEKAASLWPVVPFSTPPGIVSQTVDPQTGQLARSGCPTRRMLPFLQGTEPKEKCALHAGGIIGFFKRLWGPKPEAPAYGH